MSEDIGKEYLVKTIANRAGFTLSDVRLIYDTLQETLYELVKSKHDILKNSPNEDIQVVSVTGLFNIRIKKIAAHEGHDAVRNKKSFFDESYKVVFTPSRKFIDAMKGEDGEIEKK